jgi:hypothetical protein
MAALILAAAVVPGAAGAAESMRDEIRAALAEPIKKLLKKENQDAVAVGEFTGPAQLDTNSGPGIQEMLADELRALRVNVAKTAAYSVKGSYAKVRDRDSPGLILVKVTAEVFDSDSERRAEFPALLRGVSDIAKILAITAALPPADEPGARKERNKILDQPPSVFVEGPRVQATKDSPYAVELWVKSPSGGKPEPRAAENRDGQAFAGIRRNEIYEVRVYNHTAGEAAVTLTIDGLDAFAFSEARDPRTGRPRYSHYIIPPAKDGKPGMAAIVGWHLRDTPPDNYSSFLVTEYGKGASSRAVATPKAGKPGVITVTFAPAYEGQPKSANDETGFGPPASVKVQAVKRSIGPISEVVSVRYTELKEKE